MGFTHLLVFSLLRACIFSHGSLCYLLSEHAFNVKNVQSSKSCGGDVVMYCSRGVPPQCCVVVCVLVIIDRRFNSYHYSPPPPTHTTFHSGTLLHSPPGGGCVSALTKRTVLQWYHLHFHFSSWSCIVGRRWIVLQRLVEGGIGSPAPSRSSQPSIELGVLKQLNYDLRVDPGLSTTLGKWWL